jgi:hypothetical protein
MSWTRITVGGVRVLNAQEVIEQLDELPDWGNNINRLECTIGAAPSMGVFLLPFDALDTLPQDGTLDIVWTHDDDDSEQTVTFRDYVIVDSYAAVEVVESPLVVTVADSRMLWEKSFISQRFNCRRLFDRQYLEGTANGSSPYTISEIVGFISAELPESVSFSGVSERDIENLHFDHMPAWRALERVADLSGFRIGVNPLSGLPIAVKIATEATNFDWLPPGVNAIDIVNNPDLREPDYSSAARLIDVVFQVKAFHESALTARMQHVIEVNSILTAAGDTKATFHGTVLSEPNDWHAASDPVNYTDMILETDWFAAQYEIIQNVEAFKTSKTAMGLYPLTFTGSMQSITWQAIEGQTFTTWTTGCNVPASWLKPNPVSVGLSDYLFKTPSEGIPARNQDTGEAGSALCKPYHLDADGVVRELKDVDYGSIEYRVYNPYDADQAGDVYVSVNPVGGKLVLISGGGGLSPQIIQFTLVGEGYYGNEEVPENCIDREPNEGALYGRVGQKACGLGAVYGIDDEGVVALTDPLGLTANRDYRDLVDRTGIAVLMASEEQDPYAYEPECFWVVVYIDFHREVDVVSDIIFGEKSITIERKTLKVWDDCKLPIETIEGEICEEVYYDGGGV